MWRAVHKTRRRPEHEQNVFAAQLAALHAGAPVDVILPEVFGTCLRGIAWQHDVVLMMRHARIDEGVLVDDQAERPLNHPVARRVLRFVLTILGRLQRHGKMIGIVGRRGFWGVQLDKRRRTEEELLELRQRQLELELSGRDPSVVNTDPYERTHRPAGRHGGLAEALEMSVRNLGRYAALARLLKLFGCRQPDKKAKDQTHVVVPKNGKYAYGVWSILRPLPSLTLQILRTAWSDFRPSAPAPHSAPSRPSAPRPSSCPHTGPPTSSGAAGAPCEDPAGDIDDEDWLQLESDIVALLHG